MHLKEDMGLSLRRKVKMMAESICSVGLVVERISGEIFHHTRVVDLIFMVLRRHKQLDMLHTLFLGFM